MKKILDLKTAITIIGAYAGSAVFFSFFSVQMTRESLLVYGVLIFGLCLCIKNMVAIKQPRLYVLSGLYSGLLSASFVLGKSLYDNWKIEYADLGRWIVLGLVIFCIVTNIMQFVLCHTRIVTVAVNDKIDKKLWLIRGGILFVFWLPCFLTFYPGSGSSDSCASVMQALGEEALNNHHPVMFTLLVRVCLKIGAVFGGTEEGIAVFSVVQMLLMAVVLSLSTVWMEKHGASKKWGWVATTFWAINPIVAVYSITMWKDVLFSIWIMLFVMFLYDVAEGGADYLYQWKNLAKLACLCFLVAFGRNNGIYIVVLVMITALCMYRKYWKRFLPFFAAVFILIVAIQGPVYAAFGIKKGGFAESVAIPMQQMAHTVAMDGNITEEQGNYINQLLPTETIKEVYNPYIADAIKFNQQFNASYLEQSKDEFLKVWAQMLPANLKGYMEAYGLQTMGYWYLDVANWKCTFGLEYAEQYNLRTVNVIQSLTGVDSSRFIQNAVAENDIMPVVSYLFKVATPVWLILFLCCVMIWQKRKRYTLSLLPLVGVWGTLMIATPVYCEFRYMFSLHLALPLLAAFLFYSPQEEGQSLGSRYDKKTQKDVCILKNPWIRVAVAFVLALISCQYVSITFDSKATLFVLFLAFAYDAIIKRLALKNKMLIGAGAVLSILWGIAVTIGRKIDIDNKVFLSDFSVMDVVWAVLFGAIAFVVICFLLESILRYTERTDSGNNEIPVFSRKNWIIIALLMILCWCPYFLTYFPGNLSVDSYSSIAQSIGGELWNNHHPVMFTLFVKICLTVGNLFGSLEAGVCIFSLLQMTMLSLTLSYCLEWMRQKCIPFIIRVASFVFFGFSPLIAMYSCTMWKDILFSCWCLLLAMTVFDIVQYESDRMLAHPKTLFRLTVLCLLVAFGRNNGIYIVIATLFALAVSYRTLWKKTVPVFFVTILSIVLIQGPGYDALNILKGHFAESVGIPLQQIGYTVKNDGYITDEQAAFLNEIMPLDKMKEAYDATSSNGIKFHQDFNNEFLEANKAEFIKVWTELLIQNPGKFVKAYCMQTMGYWQLDTIGYTYVYGADDYWIDINERNIIQELFNIDLSAGIQNKLPLFYNQTPFVNLLFSTGFPIWLLCISAAVLFVRKRLRYAQSLVPLLVLWGTLMIAAPTHGEFRYVFSMNLAIPFMISVALTRIDAEKERKM